jgi:hypothetical protein
MAHRRRHPVATQDDGDGLAPIRQHDRLERLYQAVQIDAIGRRRIDNGRRVEVGDGAFAAIPH